MGDHMVPSYKVITILIFVIFKLKLLEKLELLHNRSQSLLNFRLVLEINFLHDKVLGKVNVFEKFFDFVSLAIIYEIRITGRDLV